MDYSLLEKKSLDLIKLINETIGLTSSPNEKDYWTNEILPSIQTINDAIKHQEEARIRDLLLYANRKLDYAPPNKNEKLIKSTINSMYTETL